MAAGTYTYACGKRKSAIARVKLYKGSGKIVVNGKPLEEYFSGIMIGNVKSPLHLVAENKSYDVEAMVQGGGKSAQSDAVRHGIARAVQEDIPSHRTPLKKAGLLTRDSREKERRKYGLKKARKDEQFSKR